MMGSGTKATNALIEYIVYVSGPGAPADVRDMNISGAVTQCIYKYVATKNCIIHRLNLVIADGGIAAKDFGGILGGLATGVTINVIDPDGSTILKDLNGGYPIKQNHEFGGMAGVDSQPVEAAGDDFLYVRYSFDKFVPQGIQLAEGAEIRFTWDDDLSPLTDMKAMVQGQFTH